MKSLRPDHRRRSRIYFTARYLNLRAWKTSTEVAVPGGTWGSCCDVAVNAAALLPPPAVSGDRHTQGAQLQTRSLNNPWKLTWE